MLSSRTLRGGLSLALSGAACLNAQITIQRYASVLFGGMDALIMNVISFSFIAGLGAGALVAGNWARKIRRPNLFWGCADLVSGAIVLAFLPLFTGLHHWLFALLGDALSGASLGPYYVYVIALQLMTSFLLAFVMGTNYPLAFETLAAGAKRGPNLASIFVVSTNTLGAALGCAIAVFAVEASSLSMLMTVSGVIYLAAGAIAATLAVPAQRGAGHASPVVSAHVGKTLDPGRAAALLFASGAAGYGFEVCMFRHFPLINPYESVLFGLVLFAYLFLWSLGTAAASWGRLTSSRLVPALAVAIAISGALLVTPEVVPSLAIVVNRNILPNLPWLVLLLLPAFCSGCVYGAVHREVRALDTRRLSLLYAANLLGTLLGGIVAGYVLPPAGSFLYTFVLFPPLLLAVHVICRMRRKFLAVAGLLAASAAGYALALGHEIHTRYYAGLMRVLQPAVTPYGAPVDAAELREDFSTSAWVWRDTLWVAGRAHTWSISTPYTPTRLAHVAMVALLKQRAEIFNVGIGLGISNGAIGHYFGASHAVNVDYSPAVLYFIERHGRSNFGLARQPNSEVLIVDGRLALMRDKRTYDIIAELTEQDGWPGASTVKSREFLQMVKRRLKPGGVYMAVGTGRFFASTLQATFRHVYAVRGLLTFVASDEDIRGLVATGAFEQLRREDPQFDAALRKHGRFEIIDVPLLADRLVTDLDPCADYNRLARGIPLDGEVVVGLGD
jgi:spermidine synthase